VGLNLIDIMDFISSRRLLLIVGADLITNVLQ